MPNSEYLRLKALLESNPQYKVMLDTISKAEGTWGKNAYSTKYGGGTSDWKNGKFRGKTTTDNAHGKYQMVNSTYDRLKDSLKLSGFSPEEQDIAAMKLMEERGVLKELDNGNVEGAIFKASEEWAGLPKNQAGESFYSGAKWNHQKAKPLSTVLGYMKSNEAARAGINDGYEKANNEAAQKYQKAKEYYDGFNKYLKDQKNIDNDSALSKEEKSKKRKELAEKSKYSKGEDFSEYDNSIKTLQSYDKEKDKYVQDLRNINGKNISEAEKNKLKHALKRESYRDGKLAAVQQSMERDNTYSQNQEDKVKKLYKLASEYNQTTLPQRQTYKLKEGELAKNSAGFLSDLSGNAGLKIVKPITDIISQKIGDGIATIAGTKDNRASDEMLALAKELGIKLNFENKDNNSGRVTGTGSKDPNVADVDLELLNADIKKFTVGKRIDTEKGLLKYGKTKDEYDTEVGSNTPQDSGNGGLVDDIVNDTAKDGGTTTDDKKTIAKPKPFEGSALLNSLTAPDEWADPKFEYVAGKGKMPFDALIGLTTGIVGAAQADDVHIKYRDEQISEGMLQYAQDIAKIKNMGLSPEIEGGLKMKLQDAYQTGLTNIVRASNGNRNLVLGNQGQLDKARMSGIVEMAALDVDRTDKAMAAFGEVQQYINDFDSRRDIANNERKYTEDKFKRQAGMEVAQQGMSNFIDAIKNAKENAPGSMNDMRRQWFQFNATGILPNAEEGKVGSLSYKKAKEVEREVFKGKKRTYRDWVNGKTAEEKDVIHNILTKNPNLNPDINKKTEFKELEDFYNDVSGNDEYKSDFYKSKGISELTNSKVNAEAEKITAEPKEVLPIEKEKQHIESLDSEIKTVTPLATSREIVKPKYSPEIVTTKKLPDTVLQQDQANMANEKPSGVNSLIPENIQKEIIKQKAEMNSIYEEQKQTISGLSDKSINVLDANVKSNQIIDNITSDAERRAEEFKSLIH